MERPFPQNFVWGVAAAAYQIEGAAYEDGKGLSVWDMMSRKPGAIKEGHTGDVACDHYHRYGEDIDLMRQLGIQGYRLSLSWPRVLPTGSGTVNHAGLAFYDRLIDALLAANITPYVTLFHWDYPYELYCRGGWLNRESADWFADYTRVIVDALSDRVVHWMTLNEPQCFIVLGHGDGIHAPGDQLDTPQLVRAAHHALLAHGKAVQVIRAHAKQSPVIGYAPVGWVRYPASESPEDIEAARAAMFAVSPETLWNNAWWMDPVCFGRYPEDGLHLYGQYLPETLADDLHTICQPLDFFGTNIYHGAPVRAGENGTPEVVGFPIGYPHTAFDWPVTPEALYWGPRFFWERYRLPIVITENGMANTDQISLDDKVHDPQRIDFLKRYLRAFHRVSQDGVDIRGYFQWSIMDNFEWAEGYAKRFGLVYVNYETQRRIPKDSAHWYAQVIASHGAHVYDE